MYALYIDQQLRTIPTLIDKVIKESKRQIDIFGIQRKTLDRWCLYAAEEAGEVAKAACQHLEDNAPRQKVAEEAIQAATLYLKIAEMAANPE